MSKTVIRTNGEISHIKVATGSFLSKRDKDTFDSHSITENEIKTYYEHYLGGMLEIDLRNLLNNDIDKDYLRLQILITNGYIKDEILTGE